MTSKQMEKPTVEYLKRVLMDRLLDYIMYVKGMMINMMRLARRLCRVVEMVMETWDKAKVVGYREKEYNVRMVQDDEQPGDF